MMPIARSVDRNLKFTLVQSAPACPLNPPWTVSNRYMITPERAPSVPDSGLVAAAAVPPERLNMSRWSRVTAHVRGATRWGHMDTRTAPRGFSNTRSSYVSFPVTYIHAAVLLR